MVTELIHGLTGLLLVRLVLAQKRQLGQPAELILAVLERKLPVAMVVQAVFLELHAAAAAALRGLVV